MDEFIYFNGLSYAYLHILDKEELNIFIFTIICELNIMNITDHNINN